jgi:mRNA (guanine-N7-)-methyltransferase
MYDPARDSWNGSDSEKDSSNTHVTSDEPHEKVSVVENQPSAEESDSRTALSRAGEDSTAAKRPRSKSGSTSPPRRLKKPSARVSVEEREKRARELRERLEKEEKQRHPDNEPIRQHYNARPNVSVVKRKESPIIRLRSFNNFIKSLLIRKYGAERNIVLDIGCGKGGDLQKWMKQRISGLIGIDIADVSLNQARSRYKNIRNKQFWADFCVGDAFADRIEDIVHPDAFPVDLVSSQFTLQYSFESEERARTLLSNVSRALRRGGRFIGCIPNSDVILEHIHKLEDGEKEWGNKIYKIRFHDIPPKDFSVTFGHKYDFFLEDAVGNVPEYCMPFDAFESLAQEYGFELLSRKPFLEMFDEAIEFGDSEVTHLCQVMGVVKEDGSFGIAGDEREAAGIYTTFAFEKRGDADKEKK